MTNSPEDQPAADWMSVFSTNSGRGAFNTERDGVAGLWTSLTDAASHSKDPNVRSAFETLAKVASLFVRPDDWHTPYGPALTVDDRRSAIPSDLTVDEIATLRAIAPFVPHTLLRARVNDVLSVLSSGQERVAFAGRHLDALIEVGITSESWMHERAMWSRGLMVARRYGKPMSGRLAKLEQELRRVVRTSKDGLMAVRAADMLAEHGLARDRARVIAERLEKRAESAADKPEVFRAYLRSAAEWFIRAGLSDRSHRTTGIEIQSLVDEAEARAHEGEGQGALRGSHLFELALQRVRALPKAARNELGLSHLPALIARRIRELGAAALGSMTAFTSETIDLSSAARRSRDQVKDRKPIDALLAFSALLDFASYSGEMSSAEDLIREHPLQSLFSTVHFSRDGRVVFRSGGQGGEPIYGIDPAVWQQMIQSYMLRIRLLSQGVLWPAFVQLTNEHHLVVGDFVTIVRDTGLVPADRTIQVARALYYGFNGDFSTATQLLTPQLENLVRHHLANSGEPTSTITPEHTEAEVGISALMERASATDVFGEDLAFELRALLCGPIGPNLRNEVAHGLLTDTEAASGSSLYLWWFALRLVFIPYWNALHDTDAAGAREPAVPSDRADT